MLAFGPAGLVNSSTSAGLNPIPTLPFHKVDECILSYAISDKHKRNKEMNTKIYRDSLLSFITDSTMSLPFDSLQMSFHGSLNKLVHASGLKPAG